MDIHYWEVIWPKLCGHETITILKGLPQTVATELEAHFGLKHHTVCSSIKTFLIGTKGSGRKQKQKDSLK